MRKLLAVLVTLCMLVSYLPVSAMAETAQNNTQMAEMEVLADSQDIHAHHACSCALEGVDCGVSHETDPIWTAWKYGDTFQAGKYYYLTENVVLSGNQAIGIYVENVVLCLNGHSITVSSSRTANKYLLQVGASGMPASVTLMNCGAEGGLNNCVSSSGGGAVLVGHTNTASSLKMIGVTLSGNVESNADSRFGGGAVHVRNGSLTAEYCTFSNNRATGVKNGSNVGSGGAISVYQGSATIKESTFNQNSAVQYGGAIYLRDDSNATLQLTDCTVSGNEGRYGAAIYQGKGCTVTATRTDFTSNTGTYGAVYTAASTAVLKDVTMDGNDGLYVGSSAADITVSGNARMRVNLAKTASRLKLGALGANADLQITTLDDDETISFLVAGEGFDAAAWAGEPNWIFYENLQGYVGYDATSQKYVIRYHTHHACECAITGASCVHNEAVVKWEPWSDSTKLPNINGKYYYLTTDVVLSGKNTVTAARSYLCLNGHSISLDEGKTGAVLQTGDKNTAVNYTLMDCRTEFDASTDKYTYKKGISGQTDTAGSGTVQAGGGQSGNQLALIGIKFSNNKENIGNANYGGGAVHLRSGALKVYGCEFSGNQANGVNNGENVGSGGAISIYAGNATIKNTTFNHNTAVKNGGAIYMRDGSNSVLSLDNCRFEDNRVQYDGSAVYVGEGCQLTVSDTEFSENKAEHYGTIYMASDAAASQITGGSFTSNAAAYGSALFINNRNTITITDTMFGGDANKANTTTKNGVLYVSGAKVTLDGVTMTGNAGGLYVASDLAQVTVSGATQIIGNTKENLHIAKTGTKLRVGTLTAQAKMIVSTAEPSWQDPDDYLQVADGVTLADTEEMGITYEVEGSQLHIGYKNTAEKFYYSEMQGQTHEDHCYCADGTDSHCGAHSVKIWKPWLSKTSLPTEKGYYYLVFDVQLSETTKITKADATVQLCLNGKTVTAPAAGAIYEISGTGAKLTITDCGVKTGAQVGKLTGAVSSAIICRENTTLNLFEGKISGNTSTTGGGAVNLMKPGSLFNMYGGEISGNAANSAGGVYITAGAEMRLRGGVVAQNTAKTKFGGGIRVLGKLVMSGGVIEENTAQECGGGVYVDATGEGDFSGGEIADNKIVAASVNGGGGGIYVTEGSVKLNGVTVTGNEGGVYIGSELAQVTLSGATRVMNNTEGNIYIIKAGMKLLVGNLAEQAKIFVATAKASWTDPDDYLQVAGGVTLTDTENVGITYEAEGVQLQVGYKNTAEKFYYSGMQELKHENHCYCADGKDPYCGKHEGKVWKAWLSKTSLPTEKGYYYLVNNVQLSTTAKIMDADVTVQLCLNGKTVTAPASGAIYELSGTGAKLTITDCTVKTGTKGGKLTGAVFSAIICRENTMLNLYKGRIAGNSSTTGGGAVNLMKPGSLFNMYGGEISGNAANSAGGVYIASGAEMRLRGGTIADNTAKANFGGAVRVLGKLTMSGGVIEENTAQIRGGGVYVDTTGEGEFSSGTITGNKALAAGTDGGGGGIYVSGGIMKLSGTDVIKNVVHKTALGGGVAMGANAQVIMSGGEISGHTTKVGAGVTVMGGTEFLMTGGVIKNNTAVADENSKGGEGGGVYVAKNSKLTMKGKDASIRDNTADQNGGGVAVYDGGVFTITAGRVENNTAVAKNGGGVYLVNAEAELKGGYFIANQVKAESGGGLATSGKCTVNLNGTYFNKNSAYKNAGGILIAGAGSVLTFQDGVVSENKVGKSGGGIFISKDAYMDMQGGTVKFNTAKEGGGVYIFFGSATLSGGMVNNNTVTENGGGMFVTEGSSATIAGTTRFVDNTAVMGAGVLVGKASTLTVSGGVLEKNDASKFGGGVAVQNQSKLVFTGGEMSENTAESGGAVLLNSGSTMEMSGKAAITGNRAKEGYGGGITAASSSKPEVVLTLSGGTISDNMATKTGGGIHMSNGILKMSDGNVSDNTAGSMGGGIYLIMSKATLSGGKVSNNLTLVNGGGISTSVKTTLNLKGVTISGNTSKDEAGCGGGVLLAGEGSVLNFSSGKVTGNKVNKSGAGLYISKNTTLNMSGGTVSSNKAGESGGGLILGLCTTNITGGTVSNNISGGTAGGISNSGKCLINISGLTIANNTAEKAGGGFVLVTRDSVLNMADCVIKNNVSKTNNGGGLYQGRYSTVNLTNVKFIGNKAERKGGGLYLAGEKINMKNVTIDGNASVENGGGVLLETWSKLFADGLEVHNNTTTKHGGGFYLTAGTATELRNGNFTGNKAGERGAAIWTGADLVMHSLKVTGNTSGKLGTVYLSDNKYDGESYMSAFYSMSGDMIITDNPGEGKDLYLSGVSCMSIAAPGLGKETRVGISLKEGVLTDKVYGEYNYDGGNLEYVITYGNRSVTNPEILPVTEDVPAEEQPDGDGGKNIETGMIAAAAIVAVLSMLVVLLLVKKKKHDANKAEKGSER